MTLLLREVGRFLLGAFAWIGSELAIAAAVGFLVAWLMPLDRTRAIGAGFLGAVVLAALAVRVGAPLAWAPGIGGRPLPMVWSIIGAGVAVAAFRQLQREPTAAA